MPRRTVWGTASLTPASLTASMSVNCSATSTGSKVRKSGRSSSKPLSSSMAKGQLTCSGPEGDGYGINMVHYGIPALLSAPRRPVLVFAYHPGRAPGAGSGGTGPAGHMPCAPGPSQGSAASRTGPGVAGSRALEDSRSLQNTDPARRPGWTRWHCKGWGWGMGGDMTQC